VRTELLVLRQAELVPQLGEGAEKGIKSNKNSGIPAVFRASSRGPVTRCRTGRLLPID